MDNETWHRSELRRTLVVNFLWNFSSNVALYHVIFARLRTMRQSLPALNHYDMISEPSFDLYVLRAGGS
jgi:hypothetical protein